MIDADAKVAPRSNGLRIAVLLHRFPGLSLTFVQDQITGLIDRGHSITIYASHRGEQPFVHADVARYSLLDRTTYFRQPSPSPAAYVRALPVFVRSLARSPMSTLRSLNVIRYGRHAYSLRLLHGVESLGPKKHEYDVIHCHFGPAGIKGALFRELGLLGGKLVTTFHGYDVTQYPSVHGSNVYKRHLFQKGDLFMALSEHMKDRLVALGCRQERLRVHHNGIHSDVFAFAERRKSEGEKLRLISVNRLSEKKGLSYAIRAVAELGREHDVEYRIVGDGELREELETLIRDLGVGDRVHLLGWKDRSEVSRLLYWAHIFLAPSVTASNLDEEGIPTSIMEAAASGLPVLSTFHSGIPELVLHEESGVLVQPRDHSAIKAGLLKLLERADHWAQMGAAGRRHVEQQFDIENLNDRLVDTYQRLVSSRP